MVVFVRHNSSHKRVFIKPEDACEQERTDVEKGSGVNKQSEVENYKSYIKLKSFTQKVGSEESTIDQGVNSGEDCSETSLIQTHFGPK